MISVDTFLLGPLPEIENDSQTSNGVFENVVKSILNFLSRCYQKVKGSRSLIVTISFAIFIIIMIFITPTILFGGVYKLDYSYCKNGSYAINITDKEIKCEGWFEFRYLNLMKYSPMCSNIH